MKSPHLIKEHFALRPMRLEDASLVLSWRNSERVRGAMFADDVITAQEHALWMQRVLQSERDDYRIFEHLGRPVGLVNAAAIDRGEGTCSCGYYVGVEDAPKGAGTAMMFFMLEHLFGSLPVRLVRAQVFAFNGPSLRMLEKLRFRQEDRLVKHRQKNGAYHDVIVLALPETDWRAQRGEISRGIFSDSAV